MKHAHVVNQLAADVDTIIALLPAALEHLREWTGEMPSPSTGGPPPSDTPPPVSGDHATRLTLMVIARIRLAAAAGLDMFANVDGVRLPVEIVHEAHSLAVLRWTIKRLHRDVAQVPPGKLDNLSRLVAHARSLVVEHQPPSPSEPSGCRLHRAIGVHEPVDSRYRAHGLCRDCGEFRRSHDRCEPTPAILRARAKGIKPTAAQIAEAVSAGKKKRKGKR